MYIKRSALIGLALIPGAHLRRRGGDQCVLEIGGAL